MAARCSECRRDIPDDEWGYGTREGDWSYHVAMVQVSETEQEQRLCGPRQPGPEAAAGSAHEA